jgi:hypothetical protein
MNIFKKRTLHWWQIGILKLSVASIAIAIGAQWSNIFLPYTNFLILFGIILGAYLFVVWFRQ